MADVGLLCGAPTGSQGVDSLYSIVQMPRGVPVATVAIGNAENAGLLAVRQPAAAPCLGNYGPLAHPILTLCACR